MRRVRTARTTTTSTDMLVDAASLLEEMPVAIAVVPELALGAEEADVVTTIAAASPEAVALALAAVVALA